MEVRIRNFPDFRERLPKVRFSFFKRVCFWKSNPTKRVNFRIFIRILSLFKGERIRLCQSNLTPIKSKYSFYKHELFVQLVSYQSAADQFCRDFAFSTNSFTLDFMSSNPFSFLVDTPSDFINLYISSTSSISWMSFTLLQAILSVKGTD